MIRKCSWCGNVMGRKEPLTDGIITHGICLACTHEVLDEAERAGLTVRRDEPELAMAGTALVSASAGAEDSFAATSAQ